MFKKILLLSVLSITLTAMELKIKEMDQLTMRKFFDNSLLIAARHNKLLAVEKLLLYGVNINSTDHAGQTPLIIAAMYGHEDIANFLVSKNASLKVQDMFGKTALDNAKEFGHRKIVELLESAQEIDQLVEMPISPEVLASIDYDFALKALTKPN